MEPIRFDFHLYNESTGILITSKAAGQREKPLEPGTADWCTAVADGVMTPIALVQDDPVNIRIVIGNTLTAQEEAEWIDHFVARLDVTDGRLLLSGGASPLMEPGSDEDEYVYVHDVAPGMYRIDVYTYLPGVNSEYCLNEAGAGKGLPLGQWFRQSYPGQPFPDWLILWCVDDPEMDPGHPEEHEEYDFGSHNDWVDFLVLLTPVAPDEVAAVPVAPLAENGWVPIAVQPRWPASCPQGLVAQLINAWKGGEEETVETTDVRILLEERSLAFAPLDGDPVALAPESIAHAYLLAWLSDNASIPQVSIRLPAGITWEPQWPKSNRARAEATEDGWSIGFVSNGGSWTAFHALTQMAPALANLPDGTWISLDCAVPELEDEDEEDAADSLTDWHRYAGVVHDGAWLISDTYPAVPAPALVDALALSAQANGGEALLCRDEDEARSVHATAADDSLLYQQNPRADGLRLLVNDPLYLLYLAVHLFSIRHNEIWPVYQDEFSFTSFFNPDR